MNLSGVIVVYPEIKVRLRCDIENHKRKAKTAVMQLKSATPRLPLKRFATANIEFRVASTTVKNLIAFMVVCHSGNNFVVVLVITNTQTVVVGTVKVVGL